MHRPVKYEAPEDLTLCTCTECGKQFLPAVQHMYKIERGGKQCSYTCWQKAKAKLGDKKPRASYRREKG